MGASMPTRAASGVMRAVLIIVAVAVFEAAAQSQDFEQFESVVPEYNFLSDNNAKKKTLVVNVMKKTKVNANAKHLVVQRMKSPPKKKKKSAKILIPVKKKMKVNTNKMVIKVSKATPPKPPSKPPVKKKTATMAILRRIAQSPFKQIPFYL